MEIKGDKTDKEKELIKQNVNSICECKKCNELKHVMNFGFKREKNKLWYFNSTCNHCHYLKKLEVHAKNLTKYNDVQKYKENFTIEGRALLLRNRCKQRSKICNKEFKLNKHYLIELLKPLKCSKTGVDLILDDQKFNPYAPSIDRIDNNKGYVDSNIQIVCTIYNFCKNQFTDNQVNEFFNKLK